MLPTRLHPYFPRVQTREVFRYGGCCQVCRRKSRQATTSNTGVVDECQRQSALAGAKKALGGGFAAIVRGETETGVTTMRLDEGMDTGPLFLARSTVIGPEETAGQLQERLARIGADLLLETLRGLISTEIGGYQARGE